MNTNAKNFDYNFPLQLQLLYIYLFEKGQNIKEQNTHARKEIYRKSCRSCRVVVQKGNDYGRKKDRTKVM